MKSRFLATIGQKLFLSFCLFLCFLPAFSQTSDYAGSIGKNLAIRLTLTQRGDQLTGQYLYEKVGELIHMQGSLNAKGDVLLDEFAEKGIKTGTFKGKLSANGIFTGTWAKPNSSKSLACSFRRIVLPAKWDGVSGSYKRFGKDGAFIDVELQADGRVKLQGQAFWYGDPKTGNVHTGDVSGIIKPISSSGGITTLLYNDDNGCSLTITISDATIMISDEKGSCGGANVFFAGMYKRVGNPPKKWDMLDGK